MGKFMIKSTLQRVSYSRLLQTKSLSYTLLSTIVSTVGLKIYYCFHIVLQVKRQFSVLPAPMRCGSRALSMPVSRIKDLASNGSKTTLLPSGAILIILRSLARATVQLALGCSLRGTVESREHRSIERSCRAGLRPLIQASIAITAQLLLRQSLI